MDLYHVWCNLKPGVRDHDFLERVQSYLGHLREQELIAGFRVTRKKLGLGPSDLPEFHIIIELEGLAQRDRAFGKVAARNDPIESFHHAVNSQVRDASFALYRDFPDPVRAYGEEKF